MGITKMRFRAETATPHGRPLRRSWITLALFFSGGLDARHGPSERSRIVELSWSHSLDGGGSLVLTGRGGRSSTVGLSGKVMQPWGKSMQLEIAPTEFPA
jgi:hypothetical protein